MGEAVVSSVDEIVLNSERLDAPLTLHLEVALDRVVGLEAVAAAWATTLERYPIAGVRLTPSRPWDRTRRWRWTRAVDSDPVVVTVSGAIGVVRGNFYSDGSPLTHRPAVTVGVLDQGDSSRLLFRGHHGALDGRSLLTIVSHVLATLGGEGQSTSEDIAGTPGDMPGERSSRASALLQVLRRPAPTRVDARGGADAAGYEITTGEVDAAVLADAVDQMDGRVTVNDLLVAALHRTISSWNRGRSIKADLIRVTVPFDLRDGPADMRLGNLSSQLSTESTTEVRCDSGLLLRDVHQSVSQHRRLGLTDPSVTAGSAAFLPVGIRKGIPRAGAFLTRDRFLDSSRLSNLGRVEGPAWDWAAVTGVWFSVPTRMPQGVALGVVTHQGTVHLGLRWCRRLFGASAGAAFYELYLEELAGLAGVASFGV